MESDESEEEETSGTSGMPDMVRPKPKRQNTSTAVTAPLLEAPVMPAPPPPMPTMRPPSPSRSPSEPARQPTTPQASTSSDLTASTSANHRTPVARSLALSPPVTPLSTSSSPSSGDPGETSFSV